MIVQPCWRTKSKSDTCTGHFVTDRYKPQERGLNMDYNEIMSQLAQYMRIADETEAIIDGLKDQLKAYMQKNSMDTLNGTEHKATYKAVTSNRIDTTALKRDLPDVARDYTKSISTMRFTFA